ncbi:Hypothetical predicted protein [Paramuricea clavata]|uniref:Uncharacterized protein n=1 Tax=Paramuricea clavata TaxID=317549 RepID=A0A6S7IF63_PARCT|nr:Hypothetical predicted protein [Paramuricea clavata]
MKLILQIIIIVIVLVIDHVQPKPTFDTELTLTNSPCGYTLCPFNTRCIAVDGAARCEPVLDLDPICSNVECNLDQKCALLDGKATCQQACSYDRDCQLKLVGSSCDTLLGICK